MPDDKATPPIIAPALGGGAERLRAHMRLHATEMEQAAAPHQPVELMQLYLRQGAQLLREFAALETPPAPPSDAEIADKVRAVMQEINACTPGTRLAEVPTLFAFGPIERALKEAYRGRGGETPPGQEGAPHNGKT